MTDEKDLIGALPERLGLKPRARVLALDLGTRTIGLALADLDMRFPAPLATVRRTKFRHDAAEIQGWIEREAVDVLVLGLPLNMDGSEGARAQSTRSFALNLTRLLMERGIALPIVYTDERLSTVAAEDEMEGAGLSKRRQREVVDAAAAAEILGRALEDWPEAGSEAAAEDGSEAAAEDGSEPAP